MHRILFATILLILSACSGKPYVVAASEQHEVNRTTKTQIFVVSHDWHTGIVIPTESIKQKLPTL